MAVKIRLTRKGKKKQPTYRVVVADERSPRDGRYIEQIGRYDPRQEPSIVEIENDRASYWLSVGAQPSDAVRKLLEISGVLESRPLKVKDPKVHVVDEAAQSVDADGDETVIEAAAVDEPETAGADATADDETAEAGDATADDESLLSKAKDAISAAAEEVADVVEEVEAVAGVVEEVVDEITGQDGDDAEEAGAEEEQSS